MKSDTILRTLSWAFAFLAALTMASSASTAFAAALSNTAARQIETLIAEKESRTPTERKIDSNLLLRWKQERGDVAAASLPAIDTGVTVDSDGTVIVDITAVAKAGFLSALERAGGRILSLSPRFRSVRARVPLSALVTIAADPAVVFVAPRQDGMVWGAVRPAGSRPLATSVSEGDVTHRANLARSMRGASGAGVKVGVISNGIDSLPELQASGDLPPVTVLPGQEGSGDEGSAMLELVHDLAPNAELYFATGNSGIANFAQNIEDLRAAGCDIIIDDVFYYSESSFQKGQAASVVSTTNAGLILQAVNDVAAAGALYFSSAGNNGNLDDGTSSTWEGDFSDGGATAPPIEEAGRLHQFAPGVTENTIVDSVGRPITLSWSDPLGGASNDYDLFVLDGTGSSVVASSTGFQTGSQDPYEAVPGTANVAGNRIVIVKYGGAGRALHLSASVSVLTHGTTGAAFGHNASPSPAYSIAATPAAASAGGPPNPSGPYPGTFGSGNVVELFSSDGPRRWFFNADGTPITPGNFLFSTNGGQTTGKPDVTAADGGTTSTPGFAPFFGTSAAAPHAGAIAALVESANTALTAAQIRAFLTSTAIDIEAAGADRDSGFGILDALAAVQATGASAHPFLLLGDVTFAEASGNGNTFVEPGECGELAVELSNGHATLGATAISAVLTTSTPGVTIAQGSSGYADLAGGAGGTNLAPFQLGVASSVGCPTTIELTLTVTFAGGGSPQVFHLRVRVGTPVWTATTTLDSTAPPSVPGATSTTGLQTVRLFRDGVDGICASSKPFPGTSGSGTRRYDAYTFTNCSSAAVCVRARLKQNSGAASELFLSAYSPTFDPADITSNYRADAGLSGDIEAVGFSIAGNTAFVVVVNEVDSGAGVGAGYTLTVDGLCFPCATYSGPGTCCPTFDTTISAPAQVCEVSSGNVASVPDAGVGAAYAWTIVNGTITSGNGTRSIAFAAGGSGSVTFGVTVSGGPACSDTGGKVVSIVSTGSCEAVPRALAVDPVAGSPSNANGVLEPGEAVLVSPSWRNNTASPVALTGTASAFGGPGGATYGLNDSTANYGSVGANTTEDCRITTGNCYEVEVSAPAVRPAQHWDTTVHEAVTGGLDKTWTLHVGDSFTDVPRSQAFYGKIETLLHTGITTGCTATTYCPSTTVSRGQMAIFVAKGIAGSGPNVPASGRVGSAPYNCVGGGASLFADVAATDIFCKQVHYIAAENVTLGCSPTQYCPAGNVSRLEMAAFIAKAIVAPGGGPAIPTAYGPDPVTGFSYNCDGSNIHFTDVSAANTFCKHVHYLWAKGVIAGCSGNQYCPSQNVTRDAMAKFLSNAFKLQLYGP